MAADATGAAAILSSMTIHDSAADKSIPDRPSTRCCERVPNRCLIQEAKPKKIIDGELYYITCGHLWVIWVGSRRGGCPVGSFDSV